MPTHKLKCKGRSVQKIRVETNGRTNGQADAKAGGNDVLNSGSYEHENFE